MLETSAGAIVYTLIDTKVYYLVIQDFHGNYGFPKGHIEAQETAPQAALREIREEVGIDVVLDTSFEYELNYVMPNGIDKRSIYYLGSYHDQIPVKQEEEVQKILLLPFEETVDILTFDNMKDILRKADRYIHEKQRTDSDN